MMLKDSVKAWAQIMLSTNNIPSFIDVRMLEDILSSTDIVVRQDTRDALVFNGERSFAIPFEIVYFIYDIYYNSMLSRIRPTETTVVRNPFIDWDVDYNAFIIDWSTRPMRSGAYGISSFIDNYFDEDKKTNQKIPTLKPKNTTPVVLTF